jgi:nitroimidazol reductase NimA-like FMN-containing flavoprotein (pyridoxamine 5'-phosphate oxidase superfamily)
MAAEPSAESAIVELDRHEIDTFLDAQLIGRIGCYGDGETYVVPVIYAYDGECLYVYSVEGRKIELMRANPRVCFEVDEYDVDGRGGWRSVIVDGVYEELEGAEAQRTTSLLAERFARAGRTGRRRRATGGRSPVAFRIRIERATGRAVRPDAPHNSVP